jgi:hypothetical protein
VLRPPIAQERITHGPERVRGYGTWLTAVEDMEVPADALVMGAALARHHGRDELASRLDARGSRAMGPKEAVPYRT